MIICYAPNTSVYGGATFAQPTRARKTIGRINQCYWQYSINSARKRFLNRPKKSVHANPSKYFDSKFVFKIFCVEHWCDCIAWKSFWFHLKSYFIIWNYSKAYEISKVLRNHMESHDLFYRIMERLTKSCENY